MKYGKINPIDIKEVITDKNIELYPNPAYNSFTINYANAQNINIINALGQFVLHQNIDKSSLIDVSSLQRGVYFAIIEDAKGDKIVEKIIIE